MKTKFSFISLTLLVLASFRFPAHAQTTAFTYQGKLDSSGAAANGIYDLRFAIYNDASAGTLVARENKMS